MAIRVALHHRTRYEYDRRVNLYPQLIRLRPAPHCRTPILSYSLKVAPEGHFENWQQDPHGNFLLRAVFPEKTDQFSVEVDLVADMTIVNPFDFFVEASAETFPFQYEPWLARELRPFLECDPVGPKLQNYLATIPRANKNTVFFLVDINQRLRSELGYLIRLEPGVQTAEETLTLGSGSCRDQAWLMVQILRNLGIAARFVSGYSIQLTPDVKAIDGPIGVTTDVTDLHAWTEAYLPGAGWIGMDPTSGLLTGEGHIPLAATPDPFSAAPISGGVETCESKFHFDMGVKRIFEDPRVTLPYDDATWNRIESLGHELDRRLEAGDVRLTMGGEPTFVSIDNMEAEEWNTAALGPEKRRLAGTLLRRLRDRFGKGGLLHFGQGKWYPGESLPRWALSVHWRRDGQPIWRDPALVADDDRPYFYTQADAQRFSAELAQRLGVESKWSIPAYEDLWYYLWRERRLPINVDPFKSNLKEPEERKRLARIFEAGLSSIVGYCLPLQRERTPEGPKWISGPWPVRPEAMFLLPGDSAMGFRLPLDSLPWVAPLPFSQIFELDPATELAPLAETMAQRSVPDDPQVMAETARAKQRRIPALATGGPESPNYAYLGGSHPGIPSAYAGNGRNGNGQPYGRAGDGALRYREEEAGSEGDLAHEREELEEAARQRAREHSGGEDRDSRLPSSDPANWRRRDEIVRVAVCVEARQGVVHVFLPPVSYAEDYLDLVAAVEDTAAALQMPIRVEGYLPPRDPRLNLISVTPDPGVIEVNIHPAAKWDDLVSNTTALYEEARYSRLGTEKFNLDGRHTGTGGGNHVVLGGPTPADSPFLRRPDLLRSLVAYWNNHPSLSYIFSGMFIGPTSQAPRVDEGRRDAIYELELACRQIPDSGEVPPWLVDRVFRNLLVDVTGNTHRAEFCIDKLYSPDSSTGRLGLVEFRAFEMPPHARMSLTQQLLIRALVARFWEKPYKASLVDWGTTLHDRWLLPYFLQQDLEDVCAELGSHGFPIESRWFGPHLEFRFQRIGEFTQRAVHVELRQAIEPWYVLGEEGAVGGTARYVDSSVERLQVLVRGLTDTRHVLACNGVRIPLHPTGTEGEAVAGVRYRAWQPPRCLHPTIGVHTPLVFDLVDTWLDRSLGGCTYHVAHPGGRNYTTFPVNAYEAESRRAARFFAFGHSAGDLALRQPEPNPRFPLTLDLRR